MQRQPKSEHSKQNGEHRKDKRVVGNAVIHECLEGIFSDTSRCSGGTALLPLRALSGVSEGGCLYSLGCLEEVFSETQIRRAGTAKTPALCSLDGWGMGFSLGLGLLRGGDVPELLHHTHRVIVVPALHYLALRDPLDRDARYLHPVACRWT